MKNEKGDDYEKYHVKQIDYRNIYGNLLWSTPMIFKRLHAVDEEIVNNYIHYKVERVAIAENIQHVNIREL